MHRELPRFSSKIHHQTHASSLDFLGADVLVSELRHGQHGNSVKCCLVHPIRPRVCDKQLRLGVTQDVVLRNPASGLDVRRVWITFRVSPKELRKRSQFSE